MAASSFWMQQMLQNPLYRTPGIAGPVAPPSGTPPIFGQSQAPAAPARGGLGALAGMLFPSGGANADLALQNQALLNLGMGLMAAGSQPGATFGGALGQAYLGAQGDYQGAMQNAYQSARQQRRDERDDAMFTRQEKQADRDERQAERADRQQAAVTAGRLATGLATNAANQPAYWQVVSNSPEVQDAVQQLGLQVPSELDPQSWNEFQQQLSQASQLGAPSAPRSDLQLKTVIDPTTGKPVFVSEEQALGLAPYEAGAAPSFAPMQLADGTYGVLNQRTGEITRTGEKGPPKAEKLPTETEKQKLFLLSGMQDSEKTLSALTSGTDSSNVGQALIGLVPFTGPMLQSQDYKKYQAAAKRWTANYLYMKSGATAPDAEVASAVQQYFPQPGEGPEVAAQKKLAREQEMANAEAIYNARSMGGGMPQSPQQEAPPQAVEYLRMNPGLADQFRAKYGYLPAGL